MNLLFEDMIRVETQTATCRIWRQREEFDPHDHTEMMDQVRSLMLQPLYITEVVRAIAEMDKVNSVEITYKDTGCGVCVHKDWP